MEDPGAKAGGGAVHTKKKDDPARVHEAAQQFESFMIAQMLKSMRENEESGLGTGGDAAGASALSLGDEAFAKALGESGGFGLARMIESGLEQASSKHAGAQKLKE
jgi:Rod binding domain-containing protein